MLICNDAWYMMVMCVKMMEMTMVLTTDNADDKRGSNVDDNTDGDVIYEFTLIDNLWQNIEKCMGNNWKCLWDNTSL